MKSHGSKVHLGTSLEVGLLDRSLPRWFVRAAEQRLVDAIRSVKLLSAVVPLNLLEERARLIHAITQKREAVAPAWVYARRDLSHHSDALNCAADSLEATPHAHAVTHLYAARAREAALEAAIASAVGTPGFGALAQTRFGSLTRDLRDRRITAEAVHLARTWRTERQGRLEQAFADTDPRACEKGQTPSDSPAPNSLLSRMRAEIHRQKLPFDVVVHPHLSALAATGERHVFIAAGRLTWPEDVARTVHHEVEAHVIPRVNASRAPLALFQIGTARGIDEQEGLALIFEERGQHLSRRRKRELAARHLAVFAMNDGASFVETVRGLEQDHGLLPAEAVAIAERAFRGGSGNSPGLGRERVYLESFLRVREHVRAKPEDEAILTSGQVSLDAIDALRPFASFSR